MSTNQRPNRPPEPEDAHGLETDVAVLFRHPDHGWVVQYGRGRVFIAAHRDELPEPHWDAMFGLDRGLDLVDMRHLTGVQWSRPKDQAEPIFRMRWWYGAEPRRPFAWIEAAPDPS